MSFYRPGRPARCAERAAGALAEAIGNLAGICGACMRAGARREGATLAYAVWAAAWAGAWALAQQPLTAATRPQSAPATAPTGEAGPDSPRLELDATEFDFGEIWQGMPADREFVVRNSGGSPLTLQVASSCGCTVVSKPKSPLEPGETTRFTVSYNTSHPGPASKRVTVNTNDPARAVVEIPVKGTVKPLYVATPGDRIFFDELDSDSIQTRTIRLESKYDKPLNLKLKSGQEFEPFEVEFREIESGKVYELSATTRPPLKRGGTTVPVVLETDLEKPSELTLHVMANVPPRVEVIPPQVFVGSNTTQPSQQVIKVRYPAKRPVAIKEVKATPETIHYEVVTGVQPPASPNWAYHEIRLTLPGYEDLPPSGAKVEILTDQEDPEFAKLVVPIGRQMQRPAKPGPGAKVKGGQGQPGAPRRHIYGPVPESQPVQGDEQ